MATFCHESVIWGVGVGGLSCQSRLERWAQKQSKSLDAGAKRLFWISAPGWQGVKTWNPAKAQVLLSRPRPEQTYATMQYFRNGQNNTPESGKLLSPNWRTSLTAMQKVLWATEVSVSTATAMLMFWLPHLRLRRTDGGDRHEACASHSSYFLHVRQIARGR